jgi:glycosyltransferase involved in cell wall biosynthesis
VIGSMLVRDEDRFVERSVRNVLEFCDEFLIADHGSRDETGAILARLAGEFPDKIVVRRIEDSRESQVMLLPYVGRERTWVFGVDGDEIYDPAGLARFRKRLEAGEFDAWWVIFGNVLNARELNGEVASGWLAPPCRSMTKLYNFAAITRWQGRDVVERLNGGTIHFREGFGVSLRCELHERVGWDEADFRCLHLCFLRRSSLDPEGAGTRANIMDRHAWSWRKVGSWCRERIGGAKAKDWKQEKYCRGEAVTREAGCFFR